MRHQLIRQAAGERAWVVILQTGDEVSQALLGFAREQGLHAAYFSAIGAFRSAVLGYFEWERRTYRRNVFDRQLEVVSLSGDVARQDDGEPVLHIHVVLGEENGGALGGHLLSGEVRPTLEVVLHEAPTHLRRRYDPNVGLPLIDLDGDRR